VSYTTNVVSNYQTAEYGKFIQFSPEDTNYPAVSVTRVQYPDTTLFPPGCSFPPVSSVDIYPKYAVLTYNAGPGSGPGGAFTQCETRTSGNPSFVPSQIYIHNLHNSNVNVILTLISGLSCSIGIAKNTNANHIMVLNLAVSGVNDYAGCEITYFK